MTIRPIAICVFRRDGRILVGHGYDRVKDERFFRPLGGEIEFGETAADALRREMREEVGEEIAELVRLGVLENVFTCEGADGHEIVFVYDARFVREDLYRRTRVEVLEGGWDGQATWEPVDALAAGDRPVYPEGLLDLLGTTPPPSPVRVRPSSPDSSDYRGRTSA